MSCLSSHPAFTHLYVLSRFALTAGKEPSAADISSLISSVGAEADAAQVELLLKELDGKVYI